MASFIFQHRRSLAKLNNDIELLELDLDEMIASPLMTSQAERDAWVAVQKANITLQKVKREETLRRIAEGEELVKKMKEQNKNGAGP